MTERRPEDESGEYTSESEEAEPDSYPGAAENDPSHWQQDPLIEEGEPEDMTTEEDAGRFSDQALWDETAEERYRTGEDQIPPAEPTIGEASDDVDFGDGLEDEEADASDDPSHSGGRSVGQYDSEDPGQ